MPKVDNAEVRACDLSKLQQLKGMRDVGAGQSVLAALTNAAEGDGPLDFAVKAARAKATVENFWRWKGRSGGRRHGADDSGVDRKALGETPWSTACGKPCRPSRRSTASSRASWWPRWARTAMIAGKVIATAFADGFDVTVGAMFQTPEEIAKLAVEHDVHIVGASSLAAGHLTLAPELKDVLKKLNDDILIVAGGYRAGSPTPCAPPARQNSPPGTVIPEAAEWSGRVGASEAKHALGVGSKRVALLQVAGPPT